MRESTDDTPDDHGLIRPISIPPDSRVPDAVTGLSTKEEYDRYFRIDRGGNRGADRGGISLGEWSGICLDEKVLGDLDDADLSADEQRDLIYGFLPLGNSALRQWMRASTAEDPRSESSGNG